MRKLLVIMICILFIFVSYGLLLVKGVNTKSVIDRGISLVQSTITNKPFCKDCNIVLISLDTLSANHLPCYGYKRNTAPNLCKFAKKNITFSNMFSNANYTLPSHVSIFTGLYPSQHKVNIPHIDSLSRSIPFLPEILQQNGFMTYLFIPDNSPYLPFDKVYNRGINKIIPVEHPLDWNAGIDMLKKNNEKNQKTFLFLHTFWLHSPYLLEDVNKRFFADDDGRTNSQIPQTKNELRKCTPQFLSYLKKVTTYELGIHFWSWDAKIKNTFQSMYADLEKRSIDDATFCTVKEYEYFLEFYHNAFYMYLVESLNSNEVKQAVNLYDSKIKELDIYLQGIFDQILSTDLKKNTIIIVTSDHGEEFMEHGQFEHAKNLFNTSIKVPLLIYIPGSEGKTVTQFAQSVDIMPTLLNIIGVRQNITTSGFDLFDNRRNKSVYAEHLLDGNNKTIMNQQWKLFIQKEGKKNIPYELYDMQNDPQEQNNLIFTHNDEVKRMQQYLPMTSY
ncbi:MAG: sulfatase [Microgenomates group bacterium]